MAGEEGRKVYMSDMRDYSSVQLIIMVSHNSLGSKANSSHFLYSEHHGTV